MKPFVVTVPVPPDNYSYLLGVGKDAAVIDPSGAEAVTAALKERGLTLRSILATHHHGDHTAGIAPLKEETGAMVYGGDTRIPLVDRILGDEEIIDVGDCVVRALAMPGHTRHQVAYHLPDHDIVFTGDTLFGAGCGRIFEGPPDRLYHSLMKLSSLPGNTLVYFGHEYTLENLEFAAAVEPENEEVRQRLDEVRELRSRNVCTTPSTISLEKRTNPFLREHSMAIRTRLKMTGRSPVAVFEELRNRKNRW